MIVHPPSTVNVEPVIYEAADELRNKTAEAIQQSVELLDRKDFKNYNVIDLRTHGKIVVE